MKLLLSAAVIIPLVGYSFGTYTRLGWATQGADDEVSTAMCDPGDRMVGCDCESKGTCDGTEVRTGNQDVCHAFNSYAKQGTRALVTCLKTITFREPASGYHGSPRFVCPSGYKIELCSMNNPWYPDNPSIRVKSTETMCYVSGVTCAISGRCVEVQA